MEKNGLIQKNIVIQNLKCSGCSKTIEKALMEIEGLQSVEINVEESRIKYAIKSHKINDQVENKLANLGYPLLDSENNTLHKINSFVSCAKGKLS